ncbi:MAG TPA: hypothetical protein DIV46_11530 [Verrucomicrobiales bacterium]|nr:hypothetical protein [Verrucomicrobiales bacterium]
MRTFFFLFFLPSIHGEVLYDTDFDSFPAGPNNWSEIESWISNDTTSGAQSIDGNVLPALLNTATLGFAQPTTPFTFVALNLGYDHITSGKPIVEIDTLIGIEDSTNNRRDDFYLTIYNRNGNRLASVRFDNESPNNGNSQFGIWRENVQFSNITSPINFGLLAFEWELNASSTSNHGNNFLLVADINIQSFSRQPDLEVTFQIKSLGKINLNWQTAVGWTDQVEYSSDLVTWFDDLPESTFESMDSLNFITFSEIKDPAISSRFYRVKRIRVP